MQLKPLVLERVQLLLTKGTPPKVGSLSFPNQATTANTRKEQL
jgi:hypothetical protein